MPTSRPPHLLQVNRRMNAISGKSSSSENPAWAKSILAECRQLNCEHVPVNRLTPMLLSLAIVGGGMAAKVADKAALV